METEWDARFWFSLWLCCSLVAWQQLTGAERTAVVDLLKRHHRFDDDFKLRRNERIKPADMDKWVFLQASIWPDLARNFKGLSTITPKPG